MWILVRNIPSFPVFDSKSLSLIFTHFGEFRLESRKYSVTLRSHIDDREDHFIGFSISEELFIYLRSSANKDSYPSFLRRQESLFLYSPLIKGAREILLLYSIFCDQIRF
jgi:hypothetical protein